MKTITAKQLEALEACTADLEQFKQLFGSRASITTANYRKALNNGLSVNFLIRRVLTEGEERRLGRRVSSLGCACTYCRKKNLQIAPKVVRALRAGKIQHG
jgi:hypothetical protein